MSEPGSQEKVQNQIKKPVRPHPCFISQLNQAANVQPKYLSSLCHAMNMNLGKLWEMVRGREAWRAAIPGVTKSQTPLATSLLK